MNKNFIYYTQTLEPIAVKLLRKAKPYSLVETVTGRQFNVLTRRIIPAKQPKDSSVKSTEKPTGYISIVEFCNQHNIDLSDPDRLALIRRCSGRGRSQHVKTWKRRGVSYYHQEIIHYCYFGENV